jgi:hypothetical protein
MDEAAVSADDDQGLVDLRGKLRGEPITRDDLFWQIERRDRKASQERLKDTKE